MRLVCTLVSLFLLAGCAGASSGSPDQRAPSNQSGGSGGEARLGRGGSTGSGGAGGSAGAMSNGGQGGAGNNPLAACPEAPAPRAANGQVIELPIVVDWRGVAMRHGEPNPTGDGRTVTPLNLRFYLQAVALTKSDGSGSVPADIVTAAGAVAPFGLHFFNADDAGSATLRLRAPAGEYREITFVLGMEDRCNAGREDRNPPLSAASQMTWPHLGCLFLRYEGRSDIAGGGAVPPQDAGATDAGQLPTAIHMGGFPTLLFAPQVRVSATLSVPARGGPTKRLHLALDEIFAGALAEVPDEREKHQIPLPPGTGNEMLLGEHLRQTAAVRPIFVVGP